MSESGSYQVRVRTIRWECCGVFRLEIEPLRASLPPPEPGAHIDLQITGAPLRQYSLTVGSSSERYVLGVLREKKSRGGSLAVHERLRPGDVVTISEPRNTFPLSPEGPVHLIAGGIGITPLLFMAQELSGTERQWGLTYCVRSPEHAAFVEEARALGAAFHFDSESGLPDMAAMLSGIPANTHLYCCGPGPMLDAFEAAAKDRPAHLVHLERFQPPKLEAGEGEIVIELARSGVEIFVPGDQTILDALIAQGRNPPHSCRVGICGTCETKVLEGEPDHRDRVLTEEERAEGSMMICCSRAKSNRIVLDL